MSNADFNETPGSSRYRRSSGGTFAQMWQNPIFKLVVIAVVVAGGALAGVKVLSGGREQQQSALPVAGQTSAMGGTTENVEITQDYALEIKKNDQERAAAARMTGDSSVPVPLQYGVSEPQFDSDLSGREGYEDLKAFDALLRGDDNQQDKKITPPVPAQTTPQIPPELVQNLTAAMTNQMQILMKAWTPDDLKSVRSSASEEEILAAVAPKPVDSSGLMKADLKPVVTAGSVYYGQMLIEANSDVPGPVMAQILTGPLKGGRAIGSFETFRNHLVIRFTTVSLGEKAMDTDILVLDPNTTLGGVATEVDPRYFQRVLLPAAAAFVSEYGRTLSEPTSTVTVSGTTGSNITTSTNERDAKDALYAGIGEAADKIDQFITEEGASIKRLVRVEVGTPVGLFFVKPVCGMEGQCVADSASGKGTP